MFWHKYSGAIEHDPPQEVLDMIVAENAKSKQPVHEVTQYRFGPLDVNEDALAAPVHKMKLVDCFGDSAMVLRDFLTPGECKAIIAQAETFGLTDCGYSRSIRITDRVSV